MRTAKLILYIPESLPLATEPIDTVLIRYSSVNHKGPDIHPPIAGYWARRSLKPQSCT